MTNKTSINGTVTDGGIAKPRTGIPGRTWLVGAVALPLALGAVGLTLAKGREV